MDFSITGEGLGKRSTLSLEAVEVILIISPSPTLIILSTFLPPSIVMWFPGHLTRTYRLHLKHQ